MLIGAAALMVVTVFVLRWRRRDHAENTQDLADENVCEHLRAALALVRSRGCRVTRVGQRHPDLPLEIHVAPPFDPKAVYDELKLAEPVFLSERNVLYCKEDWCELHPK